MVIRRAARLIGAAIVAMGMSGALGAPAQAGQVGVTVHIQGSGMTQVVEGTIEDGGPLTCDMMANKDDRVTNSCPRIRNEEFAEAWVWLRATASSSPSGHWRFLRWEGCDQTRTATDGAVECAVHSPCCSGVEKEPKAVFDDFVAPTVSSITETFSTTTERTVSYAFSTNEGTLQCRFDSESWGNCSSGVSRTYSTEGSKTVEVRAVDYSGNTSSNSSRTVKVLDTALTGGPSGLTNSRSATFTYSSVAGTAFECSLNAILFSPCGNGSHTYSALGDGSYTFRVRSTDGGWFDRIAATRTFLVDATAPDTALGNHAETPGEGSLSTLTTATFAFSASEAATFECKLDDADFEACSSPHTVTGLAPGTHTFQVRATDTVGNEDGTPAQRSWTVAQPDADADGYDAGVDCDDGDADINPGKPEILDNDVDENCDGIKGENLDRDGDGVQRPADCDDGNPDISPSKPEILDNDVDENCDGIKGQNLDRDGDGVQRPADCDDGNPGIRPGAAEVAGNGIDDDCRDGDAAGPPRAQEVVKVLVTHAYRSRRGHTRFRKLTVTQVPAGSTVVARCRIGRKACSGKARKAFKRVDVSGAVALKPFLKRRLKPRTVITITVTKPGAVGSVTIVTIRKGKGPKGAVRCLPPGQTAPVAC